MTPSLHTTPVPEVTTCFRRDVNLPGDRPIEIWTSKFWNHELNKPHFLVISPSQGFCYSDKKLANTPMKGEKSWIHGPWQLQDCEAQPKPTGLSRSNPLPQDIGGQDKPEITPSHSTSQIQEQQSQWGQSGKMNRGGLLESVKELLLIS